MIWTTANKERINICDMTNEHLENTIAYLYKKEESIKAVNEKYGLKINHQINNREIKEWLENMVAELKNRIFMQQEKERLDKRAQIDKSIVILQKQLLSLDGKKKKRKRLKDEIEKLTEEWKNLFSENDYDYQAPEEKKVYKEVLGGIVEENKLTRIKYDTPVVDINRCGSIYLDNLLDDFALNPND